MPYLVTLYMDGLLPDRLQPSLEELNLGQRAEGELPLDLGLPTQLEKLYLAEPLLTASHVQSISSMTGLRVFSLIDREGEYFDVLWPLLEGGSIRCFNLESTAMTEELMQMLQDLCQARGMQLIVHDDSRIS